MATANSKPEMPAFSYAQAAKGLSTTQTSVRSGVSDSTSKVEEPTVTSSSPAPAETKEPGLETSLETEKPTAVVEKEKESAVFSGSKPAQKSAVSGTSSPSVASSLPRDDETSSTRNGSSESTWDKQSQISVPDKGNEVLEGDKSMRSSVSSDKTVSVSQELKVAPLPVVNVWQQRKEAQEAKAKAMATVKPAPVTSKSANAKSPPPSSSGEIQLDSSKVASKKKGAESTYEAAKDRKKNDGGKAREEDVAIPPVEDASSWPTPQGAQGEDKKKKTQEKSEKTEKFEKSPIIRPHGKEKWMPVPYVPTAVFETPLPSASRRGGRSSRGSREASRGAAHAAAVVAGGDKPVSSQGAPTSSVKAQNSGDRGRNDTASIRANSLPLQARRATSADPATVSEQRRASQATDRPRGEKGARATDENNTKSSGKPVNGVDTLQRHHRDVRAYGRAHEPVSQKPSENISRNGLAHAESQPGTSTRLGAKNVDNTRPHEAYRDANGDGHKEKESFRDSRPERGRGSHRGRGGHSGFGNPQTSHIANSHVSHHNYVPQKSFGFGERQRPQQQQHGLPNGSQHGHRLSLRSPSLPTSTSMYGVYSYPTDVNTMYGYPAMHPGPMSALPYQQYMEPFSLMSMISMQLEYYFSVDNLCKDLFLRKHMDSQGFVLLSFIANFKRIKTLTEDFELLRHVSRQLRNVEYYIGEDGFDRLRPRVKWEQWVFPVEQRDSSAQNEGPKPQQSSRNEETTAAFTFADGVNGSTHDVYFPNGTSELRISSAPSAPLSSTAPEFSPSNTLVLHSLNANAN